ncbi:MAG: exo-alpha-sialidase [Cyclobacteriaceae bacterium]|nr:exo-alpha-sialidase [Cyclobacteriaceae bacterium]
MKQYALRKESSTQWNYWYAVIPLILMVLTLKGYSQPSPKNTLPPLAVAGEGVLLSGELIYSLAAKPTAECHASTIVEISDGLIAAWFGGSYERNPDVGIWISFNLDGTWSKPTQVADGYQNDSLRYPTWNPVLFKPANGPLMLFYKVGPNPREWWGMLMTSENEGRTWSMPRRLGRHSAIGDLLGPVKNKPIQLKDGTVLCPSSTEREVNNTDLWLVHFEATKDFGKTWEVIGPIHDGKAFNAIQPSILTYADGRMQILCRTGERVIAQSWSVDKGKTWSLMTATQLPNPDSGIDAITLRDGRQLLVYNHTIRSGPFPSGRDMLNVAVSTDGILWKTVMTLEQQEGEYSYPAVIQTTDGNVHITYTYDRRSVKHVVIDPRQM